MSSRPEVGSLFLGMNLKHTIRRLAPLRWERTSKDEPLSYAKPSRRQVEVRQQ
jgi:hypothetical protein